MAKDIIVDVLVDNKSPVVDVEVANRVVSEIKPVLHDETLTGDGIDTPMGVNKELFVGKEEYQSIIPATANPDNQLADQGFVNSSIQTSTAHFRGNWDTWADVPSDSELYPVDAHGNHAPTPNDYLVVVDDEQGGTWRYKYTGDWAEQGKDGWKAEYQINETPLTAAQLAALNSGITATAVASIANKQDKLTPGENITIEDGVISATGGGGASLPDQTDNAGKFLMTDGANVSWGNALVNSANPGKPSIQIIGNYKAAHYPDVLRSCAVTYSGYVAANDATAIGYGATIISAAQGAIQLGSGQNNDANTFKVATRKGNFEIMSADGTIPAARHAALPTEDGAYVLKCVISGGVPTMTWVKE